MRNKSGGRGGIAARSMSKLLQAKFGGGSTEFATCLRKFNAKIESLN